MSCLCKEWPVYFDSLLCYRMLFTLAKWQICRPPERNASE